MVARTSATPGTRAAGGASIIGGDRRGEGPGPDVMDADTLIGDSVVNDTGDDLGKIEAIMLDVAAGRIAYAVLSFGGVLRMGNKLFAVPWSLLAVDEDEKCFISAYDVNTGQQVWKFNTLAHTGEPGGDSWGKLGDNFRQGGETWIAGDGLCSAGRIRLGRTGVGMMGRS